MSDPLYIDNSTMRAIAECSNEAFLRYHLGYTTPEERATLRSGEAAHEALAVWFRGGSKDDALARYAELYEEWAEENVAPVDRLSYANTSRILSYWFETHPLTGLPFRVDPKLVEIGFAYPLVDDIIFCGRLDAVATSYEDRSVYVVEHKTTGSITPHWLKNFRMDSQVSGYIWAAQNHTAQLVVGAYLNAIEFSKLPSDPSRKCKTHATPYEECGHLHADFQLLIVQRSQEELEEWRKTAIHLAKRYQDLVRRFPSLAELHKVRTQGKFHGACRFCAFADFCSVGRPMDLVTSMLVHDPWSPFDFAAGLKPETSRKKP